MNLTNSHNRITLRDANTALDVSVVIVNFNLRDHVLSCIRSILASKSRLQIEIIIVDNASQDGSVSAIRREYPQVVVVESGANLGFGTANNLGFERAGGRHLIALNPDTLVPSGLISRVIERLDQDSSLGVVGVAQRVQPNVIVSSVQESLSPSTYVRRVFTGRRSKRPRYAGDGIPHELQKDLFCEAITGSFMAFRRDILLQVGGFDRRIFMYAEEVELCWRVKQAGYQVMQLGSAFVDHECGASTSNMSVWRDVQMQTGQLICVGLTHGKNAARLAAAVMSLGHLVRLPFDLTTLADNREAHAISRLQRLKRSLLAVFNPPLASRSDI